VREVVRQYLFRRFLLIVPTILGVTILVSLSIRLLPGDAVDALADQVGAGNEDEIRKELGLDKSWPEQYWNWLSDAVSGDLGTSFRSGGRTVTDELEVRLPVTIQLGIMALGIALVIALPIGIYSAIRQDRVGDYVARSFAISALAVPSFWLATLAVIYWERLPLTGSSLPITYYDLWDDPWKNLNQMWVPATILGFAVAGSIMRLTRAQMLEVMRQDYVRTAWSKGLRERSIVMRHALKNALIPVVTLIGLQVPVLVGGSVVLEQIFVLPGLGQFFIVALVNRDYPVILGINLIIATIIVLTNLAVDIAYSMLDPRIRLA
jgi:peptide/nickel transport system permease protein